MRAYRASKRVNGGKTALAPAPAPETPTARPEAPWRTMDAESALAWLLEDRRQRILALEPEGEFDHLPSGRERRMARYAWRKENGRCVKCGDVLEPDCPKVHCESCLKIAHESYVRRRNRRFGGYGPVRHNDGF